MSEREIGRNQKSTINFQRRWNKRRHRHRGYTETENGEEAGAASSGTQRRIGRRRLLTTVRRRVGRTSPAMADGCRSSWIPLTTSSPAVPPESSLLSSQSHLFPPPHPPTITVSRMYQISVRVLLRSTCSKESSYFPIPSYPNCNDKYVMSETLSCDINVFLNLKVQTSSSSLKKEEELHWGCTATVGTCSVF